MRLAVGQRIGTFEVVASLGSGGVGEVYLARDHRLGREVALKVLRESLHARPARLDRFEREARALAALNHPGIAAIYEVEQSGVPVLVLELVEGPTLAERLRRGALPVREALELARQIAEALEAAHEKGIIHRDLKPSNIKLVGAGRVKLLDFGLAKAMEDDAAGGAEEETGTADTGEGVVLGTAPYMSPEQARGEVVDRRADAWSFGCVLYEMLTGRRAFPGATASDAVAAVIAREPDWGALPGSTPFLVRSTLRRCLQKDRGRRLRDIADARIELEEALGEPASDGTVEGGKPRPARRRLAWAAVIAAGGTALVLTAMALRARPDAGPLVHSHLIPPENSVFHLGRGMAVSPDGLRIAFIAGKHYHDGTLWVRSLNAPSAQRLEGTVRASEPFWSPDGLHLGFFADQKLKTVGLSGGAPQDLCDAPGSLGGAWSREGVIVFAPALLSPLYSVPAAGGRCAPVTELDADRGESSHRWPAFLPDGRRFLYLAKAARPEATGIHAASIDSKGSTFLQRSDHAAAYAAGRLLFLRGNRLLAAPFDENRLRVTAEASVVAENVLTAGHRSEQAIFSSAGRILAYSQGDAFLTSPWVWRDRKGTEVDGPAVPPDFVWPVLSHDGRRLAAHRVDPQTGTTDIWGYDLARQVATRLTFDPANDKFVVWAPDDQRIAFTSDRKGQWDLYQKAANAAAPEELLFTSETTAHANSWSRDGRHLVFNTGEEPGGPDLWSLSLAEGKATLLLRTPYAEHDAQISPDGRWLAYRSNETGEVEIYVQPFPPSGVKWRISPAGGARARWRGDSRELFYAEPGGRLMAVDIGPGPTFEAGVPRGLFTDPHFFGYYPAPDGQRFLGKKLPRRVGTEPITLVQNWTTGLEK